MTCASEQRVPFPQGELTSVPTSSGAGLPLLAGNGSQRAMNSNPAPMPESGIREGAKEQSVHSGFRRQEDFGPRMTKTGRISKARKGVRNAHICDRCGKRYSRAEHLRRHQMNHEPIKLACKWPRCGRSFARYDMLERHENKHSEGLDVDREKDGGASQSYAPTLDERIFESTVLSQVVSQELVPGWDIPFLSLGKAPAINESLPGNGEYSWKQDYSPMPLEPLPKILKLEGHCPKSCSLKEKVERPTTPIKREGSPGPSDGHYHPHFLRSEQKGASPGITAPSARLSSPKMSVSTSSSQRGSDGGYESSDCFDGSDSASESALQGSALTSPAPFRPGVAKLLWSKFRTYANRQTAAPQGTGSGIHGQTSLSSSQRGQSFGKRKRSGKERSSDDHDEDGAIRRKRRLIAMDGEEKLLACPFCKYNPRNYRDCYKHILRNVSRVKLHLARRHRIPIHCPSCWQVFDTEAERDKHIRARNCELLPLREFDGIDELQRKQLEQRISTKKTMEENWYIIYEILFPGAPRPRSPYVDPPLSEELLALREFTSTEGPRIISEFMQHELSAEVGLESEQMKPFLETVFPDVVGFLLEQYSMSRPVPGEDAPQTGSSLQAERVFSTDEQVYLQQSSTHSNSSDSGYTSNYANAELNAEGPPVEGPESPFGPFATIPETGDEFAGHTFIPGYSMLEDMPWEPTFCS